MSVPFCGRTFVCVLSPLIFSFLNLPFPVACHFCAVPYAGYGCRHGFVIQTRALLIACEGHGVVLLDSEMRCCFDGVDICAEENEFPADFLLFFDFAPDIFMAKAPACVFHAVGRDDEHGFFRHVFLARVFVDEFDVPDGASDGVQKAVLPRTK